MYIVNNVFHWTRDGDDLLRDARLKHEVTGEEILMEPFELEDPESTDVGDEYAYKVSLLMERQMEKEAEFYGDLY